MKERYINLMAKALGAYSDGHIAEYFESVKHEDLTEHGFPRLTANLGILIAHGHRSHLLPLFTEMMDLCCDRIPIVKAANEFSVKEIVCCIDEVKDIVSTDRWREQMNRIDPERCYNKIAHSAEDDINNWAIFSMQSEWLRSRNIDFVDTQIAAQLKRFDENGMYRDPHEPIVYDLVPRLLFSELLNSGYDGQYRDILDEHLKRSGLLTLRMQSVTGEIPFGGRSSQFVFNEAILAGIFEFEAKRYGNSELGNHFKAAAELALDAVELWLAREELSHVKNYFPTDSRYGCEKYAYFDKYMITAASYLYCAYRLCDDSIRATEGVAESDSFTLSEHFHKLFLRAGGYFLEFDTNADKHYDTSGLGRVHLAGAPSQICLSLPCTATPKYEVCSKEGYDSALGFGKAFKVISHEHGEGYAKAILHRDNVTDEYFVSENGIEIKTSGNYMLPVFAFDGKAQTDIKVFDNMIEISYLGWICRYTTNGRISDSGKVARNRNGFYNIYFAEAEGELNIKIEISKIH